MSEFNQTGGLTRLVRAFGYSLAGFRACYRHEAAFRQEVLVAVVLVPLGLWLGDDGVEKALLAGSWVLVMIVELLNSAVEAVVDRISLERHPLSKNAKDMGSAAQFVVLSMIALVWGIILLG